MMKHISSNQENKTEVNVKKNNTNILVASYIVKNLNVALYLSKLYSTIYTVEIISGDKKWII